MGHLRDCGKLARMLFQAQLLACCQQGRRFLQPPQLGFLLFGGVNPCDIHSPVRGCESLEVPPRWGAPRKCFLNVPWDLCERWSWGIAASVGGRPVEPRRHQSPVGLQLGIAFAVRGGPLAVELSWRELAGVARVVELSDKTIDPSETKGFVKGILVSDRGPPRMTLVKDQPHLRVRIMMRSEPRPPPLGRLCIQSLQSIRAHRLPTSCSVQRSP